MNMPNYDNVVLMGENCELAWQYSRYYNKYPESGLFNWTRVDNRNKYLQAIENPSIITSGEIEIKYSWAMYYCHVSGCLFHSSTTNKLLNPDGTYNKEAYQEQVQLLISKNRYLAQKLENIWKSNSKKLFLYKAQELTFETQEEYKEFFDKFCEILNNKTSNFDILLIVTRPNDQCLKFLTEKYPFVHIRTLSNFTEISDAKNPNVSDNEGWKAIFKEFLTK